MAEKRQFIHLHVHSEYSLLDGACRIDRLLKRAQELEMPAIALTDHGNLFGIPQFYKAAKKLGIKPLLGCEAYLLYEGSNRIKQREPGLHNLKLGHTCLIAKNWEGYQNLTKLISDAHVNGFYYKPRVDMEHLAKYSKGLIATSGCLSGIIPQFLFRKDMKKAQDALSRFIEIFGRENFFIEVQNQGMLEQKEMLPALLKLAKIGGVRCIATNDAHYVYPEDWEAQDALLCIQTGSKIHDEQRLRMPTHQFYLKSREEMSQAFKDNPEVLDNTLLIPDMCDVELPFGENHYPVFTLSEEKKAQYGSNKEYFRALCIEGLEKRYNINIKTGEGPEKVFDLTKQEVIDRLQYELRIIEQTGFIDYFLIVWDFIHWAKSQGIPVGPGRGSAAGSIVAYVLTITDTDPIRFNLLFERFLNPERISPPDIDIDFCMRRREEVIDYVRKVYGKDNVSNIITFGTLGAKMVIRDLARVYDIPYAEADRWAKMIPEHVAITLEGALEASKELKQEVQTNARAEKVFEEGQVLEGMARNSGMHACGVLIWDKPLTEIVPTTLQDESLTTQYSKEYVEGLGLLKMDFLGLRTLTVIDDAQNFIRQKECYEDFDIGKVPLEDDKTFRMLNAGKTVGVFQLEAPYVQKLCQQFGLNSVDEISALSALNRPGPMEFIPDYINGKKNPEKIHYVHPLLESVCRKTYGVLVFQEQVMQAAQVIAGYSLGGADILRRAMGKKKVEVMQEQRSVFVKGAWNCNGIDEAKANEIFDILAKFAGYGFNKSHSDAYAIIVYRTAYLKANYPTQYMAALLSSELGDTDRLSFYIDTCRSELGIEILGPDINESSEVFAPIVANGKKEIRFGLSAIKGVGEIAAKSILEERRIGGPFKSFLDFAKRVDGKASNKRVVECLIKAGAFDSFGEDRNYLLTNMESLMKEASAVQMDRDKGQGMLFDFDEVQVAKPTVYKEHPPMPLFEKLQHERELLGFYLSGHPLDALHGLERIFQTYTKEELNLVPSGESFRICGVVEELSKRISKKNNKAWLSFVLSTKDSRYDLQLFSEAFDTYHSLIQEGALLVVEGTIRRTDTELRFNTLRVYDFQTQFPRMVKQCHWILYDNEFTQDFLNRMQKQICDCSGNMEVKISFFYNDDYAIEGELPMCCKTYFSLDLIAELLKHKAVYALEVTPTEIAPFPGREGRNFSRGNFS